MGESICSQIYLNMPCYMDSSSRRLRETLPWDLQRHCVRYEQGILQRIFEHGTSLGKTVIFPRPYSDISMAGDRNNVCVEQEELMGMRLVCKGV